MQKELDADFPLLDIQIIGVNEAGEESANSSITAGRNLPWLQDVDGDGDGLSDVWRNLWDVTYRDVVIVDADNVKLGAFNLTEHNLASPENYDALRQMLIDAASDDPQPQDLGTVDFLQLSNVDPASGDLWYRFTAFRDGVLTAALTGGGSAQNADVTLYGYDGGNLNELASGPTRVDYELAVGGGQYALHVDGPLSEVDLTLANLVQRSPDGTQVTVYGTTGDDTFEFSAGEPFVTVVNGIRYESDVVAELHFLGGGGTDGATLTGSAGSEHAVVYPNFATVSGPTYQVQLTDVSTLELHGDGNDTAQLFDSAGNDSFVGTPIYAAMFGQGFGHRVWRYGQVEAEATAGGIDVAKFYDSPGPDTYVATPTYNALSGEGFHRVARYFEGVHAYATAGGLDVAKFYDSAANDDFIATPVYAALYNATHQGEFNASFYNRAKFFEGVHAYATAGGVDVARFYDSPANDDFIATPVYAALYNTDYQGQYNHGFFNRAKFFEGAHAFATAGENDTDVARLYDSPGDDIFYADPVYGALYNQAYDGQYNTSYYNRAKFFQGVHAFATAGGHDLARLHGSDGSDRFYADPDQGTLYLPGQYYNRAKFFEEVNAHAHGGDDDRAELHDSALDDLFEAEGNWARLTNLDRDSFSWITDFDRVQAAATTGKDTKDVKPPLGFLLEPHGSWQDAGG